MGYQVRSLLALNEDRYHEIFYFFLPSRRLEYDWINDWVDQKFDAIVHRLPRQAVLVVPTADADLDDYRASLADSIWAEAAESWPETDILHSGLPLLVVAGRQVSTPRDGGRAQAHAISLGAFDLQALARLFDLVLASVESGTIDFDQLPTAEDVLKSLDPDQDYYSFVVEQAIQLKPNVFGIGIDLNEIVHRFRRMRARRQSSESHD